jgi:hypothetical protein
LNDEVGGGTCEIVAFVFCVEPPPDAKASALKTTVLDSNPITVPFASRVPPTGARGPIVLVLAFSARAKKASKVFPDRGLVWLALKVVVIEKPYALMLPTIPD